MIYDNNIMIESSITHPVPNFHMYNNLIVNSETPTVFGPGRGIDGSFRNPENYEQQLYRGWGLLVDTTITETTFLLAGNTPFRPATRRTQGTRRVTTTHTSMRPNQKVKAVRALFRRRQGL